MARGRPVLIAALIILIFVASACKGGSPLDIRAVREWAANEGYAWAEGPDEIRTEQGFFDYIDGAAQPIIDLGWKRSFYGVLTTDQSRLRLAIHEMRTPKGAAALFEQNVFKDTQSISLGDRAIYWDRGAFSKGILFQKGTVISELTLEEGGDKNRILGLASSLETWIK